MPGYTLRMRALWLDLPAETLAERRRLGIDVLDEVWDGVLHVPPSPSSTHMRRELDLAIALTPVARTRGLEVWTSTGVYGPHGSVKNYRIPDNAIARPDHRSRRGLESAELAVEWLSPHDESRDKFPFYAGASVREIWLIDPRTRALEVYRLSRQRYTRVRSQRGVVRSPVLAIELSVTSGPRLRIVDGDYTADV
jgi:Uma2 family endonuclease